MQVAIAEFLAMVPEFELEDPEAVTWAGGQVRGPRYLPVTFPTGLNLQEPLVESVFDDLCNLTRRLQIRQSLIDWFAPQRTLN